MLNIYDYLKDAVPDDHCRQTSALSVAETYIKNGFSPKKIVDLGCGTGSSADHFKRLLPTSHWAGIDIEVSPEVLQRTRSDVEFLTFDGVNIPFIDSSVDFVYSNQVLEHVRHPEKLLKDVARALSDSGKFIGQTSHLEPYHSYSLWNFTPYGFKTICEDAGLRLVELRPCIDGKTLCERSFANDKSSYNKWFSTESPMNFEIEEIARKEGTSNRAINIRKLLASGQFSFVCQRASAP
ncbi:class I SAM-dependent methyltransferase [Ensifer canadensis]|uniref:class I SAM-dependent methyltransferase n=1 Tax=Ensifer canadensis TaxID=555315 RepID=UPI0035E3F378